MFSHEDKFVDACNCSFLKWVPIIKKQRLIFKVTEFLIHPTIKQRYIK